MLVISSPDLNHKLCNHASCPDKTKVVKMPFLSLLKPQDGIKRENTDILERQPNPRREEEREGE